MDRSPPPLFKQGLSANVRFAFFATAAVVLLMLDARSGMLGAMRQGIGTVLYPVQRTLLVPRDLLALVRDHLSEVDRLRAENAELKRIEATNVRTLLQVEQLAQENRALRELTDTRDRLAVRSVVAEILYDSRDPFTRTLVIDKGLQHGVAAGQPVVDAEGVIGQITRVFALSAELTLITDRTLTVPVQIQRNALRAIASGGAEPGRLELRFMSVNADIKEGDTVVTSGLDGLYPAGIPVGRIVLIDRSRTGNFARVQIEPVAGVDRNRPVLVLRVDRTGAPPAPEAVEPRTQRPSRRLD